MTSIDEALAWQRARAAAWGRGIEAARDAEEDEMSSSTPPRWAQAALGAPVLRPHEHVAYLRVVDPESGTEAHTVRSWLRGDGMTCDRWDAGSRTWVPVDWGEWLLAGNVGEVDNPEEGVNSTN